MPPTQSFIRFLFLLFLWVGLISSFDCQPAFAHRPHDVVTQIEISPTFSQDKTLYIIVRDNLFKSKNQGSRWQRLNGIDTAKDLTSLAVSQSNGKVLFVASRGGGIYHSEDAGLSWNSVNEGLKDLNIELVSISPSSSNVVLAAGQNKGLYRTTNQGTSWLQSLPNIQITAIAFLPNPQQVLLGDAAGNLYRSDNLGNTWTKIASIAQVGAIRAIAPVLDSPTRDLVFIATERGGVYSQVGSNLPQPEGRGLTERRMMDLLVVPGSSGHYTVLASGWHDGYWQYSSADQTWSQVSIGLSRDKMADDMKVPHFQDLEVSDAFNSDGIAFLGGFDGLFKTENSGGHWQELETLSISTIVDLAISPNYANDSTLAVASYVQGLYISRDRGNTWEPINTNLFTQRFRSTYEEKGEEGQDPRRFFDIAFSPNYASDNGLFTTILWSKFLRSSNQGKDWSIVSLNQEVRGVSMVVSPNFATDQTIYLSNQQGILFQSTNGGRHFERLSRLDQQRGNNAPSLVISPNFLVDQILFSTGAEGVYKSVNGGKNWQVLTKNTPLQNAYNIQLAISPNYQTDSTLFAGSSGGLYKTSDHGKTWQVINLGALGDHPVIEAIAVSPNYVRDNTFIVSVLGNGLFRTQDNGQSFTSVGNRQLSLSKIHRIPSAGAAIQFSPNYASDKTLYGFGSATSEIFKSVNEGDTWETISISRHDIGQPNLLQSIALTLSFYSGKLIKVFIVFLAAYAGYLVYQYFNLGKKRFFLKKRTPF